MCTQLFLWSNQVILARQTLKQMYSGPIEPLALAHEAGRREAVQDGQLWRIRVTSAPEPDDARAYIEAAL